jgi:hypothetical protein
MARDNRNLKEISEAYKSVKCLCAADLASDKAGEAILALSTLSLQFLTSACARVDLVSKVPGKQYFAFGKRNGRGAVSRPANVQSFVTDTKDVAKQWRAWAKGKGDANEWEKMSYTVALAPCLAMEMFDRQNKKGPATYFECLIGHIFAKTLGVNPRKQASLPVSGRTVRLTMDFLFDRKDGVRVHLPVKMSTRERVVQAWAHQRMLDKAYGTGTYKGIMVLFAETKLDSRSHEVVEICVPDQWLAY